MPFNFLELSSFYRQHAIGTSRARRTFVCEHYLGDDYDLKEHGHSTAGAVRDLRAQGIEVSRNVIQTDAKMFRAAFEYLQLPPEKQAVIRAEVEKVSSERGRPTKLFGVKCLMEDGISTWADIERLKPADQAPPDPSAPVVESAEAASVPEEAVLHLRPVAAETASPATLGVKELASRVRLSFVETLTTTQGLLDQLLAERDRLTQRVEFLENQNSLLREELATQAKAAEQSRKQVDEWQKYGEELHAELNEAHRETLAELAEKVGARSELGREVFQAVQRFVEDEKRKRAATERKTTAEDLSGIITAGQYSGLNTVPEPKFVEDFLGLQNGERQAVKEAMKRFCEGGPLYPSFQSHVITDDTMESVPPKSYTSRASDEIRLIWRQEEDGIHFYRIARKGDRAFYKSEA